MQIKFQVLCAAVFLSISSGSATAQGTAGNYPSKPITVVIPAAPGASVDLEARLYTQKVAQSLGQPLVHDFKAGGQAHGSVYLAKSAPDGYTIGPVAASLTSVPAFYTTAPPYDPVRDFAPIALMSKRPTMFVVRASLPVNNIAEYLAYVKAHPEAINFGTSAQGSIVHLVGAWLHGQTNTKVTFIHYKGGGPMWIDLAAGRLDASVATFLMGLPFVKAGKVRPIANSGPERSPLLPDLRTMDEQGFPGFEYPSWLGFTAPARTPPAIVAKLNAELVKAARSPDVMSRLVDQGGIIIASTPEYFAQTIAADTARWRKVVQDNGIKMDE